MNSKKLIPDDTWQYFRKVRAVIENDNGEIAICTEGGKCIFPGGKCDPGEDELSAMQREISEETGIYFAYADLKKVLELETFYDDFYDFRTDSIRPRYTMTTYYFAKTKDNIDKGNMQLTEGELKQDFKVCFMDKDSLLEMLMTDHSEMKNGKFFDEENRIVVEKVLKLK